MAASKQVPFRLTETDRAKIAAIKEHFGLPSDAAAVRYAVQQMHVMVVDARPKAARKGAKA